MGVGLITLSLLAFLFSDAVASLEYDFCKHKCSIYFGGRDFLITGILNDSLCYLSLDIVEKTSLLNWNWSFDMRKSEEVVPISGLTMESGDLFSPVMVKMVKISSPLGDTYQGFLEGDMQGEKCIFLNSSISHPMPCQYSSTATIGYSFPEWAIGIVVAVFLTALIASVYFYNKKNPILPNIILNGWTPCMPGGSNSPPQLGKVADDEQPQAA